jgi:hypothetical protein
MLSRETLSIEEALARMKDEALMQAANLAYREAERANPACEETALIIGDAIRNLMRAQR